LKSTNFSWVRDERWSKGKNSPTTKRPLGVLLVLGSFDRKKLKGEGPS